MPAVHFDLISARVWVPLMETRFAYAGLKGKAAAAKKSARALTISALGAEQTLMAAFFVPLNNRAAASIRPFPARRSA
jgi:hypothetical protein